MNVLVVLPYPVFGGPHNQVLRLARPLAEQGWHSLALLPDEPGTGADRLLDAGVEVMQLPLHRLRGKADPRLHFALAAGFGPDVIRIRRVIRDRSIDLVQVIGLLNPQPAIAARIARVPIVWQMVDSRPPPLVLRSLASIAALLADVFMFTGSRIMALHGGCAGVRRPSFVFFPPVDTRLFQPDSSRRMATRRRLGIPLDAEVVGMVANLNPQKGIERFVHAAGHVQRQRPDTWFVLAGQDYSSHREYLHRIQRDIANSAIPRGQFVMAGPTDSPEELYPAFDLMVITSPQRSEGTPTTVLEAMACGLPVVSTDAGGVRDVVEDAVTGLIVRSLDPGVVAAAVLQLMGDSSLRAQMAIAARRMATLKYDVSVCADIHVKAFSAAMAARNWPTTNGRSRETV